MRTYKFCRKKTHKNIIENNVILLSTIHFVLYFFCYIRIYNLMEINVENYGAMFHLL